MKYNNVACRVWTCEFYQAESTVSHEFYSKPGKIYTMAAICFILVHSLIKLPISFFLAC